jgi:chloramphenicol 3-O-phosphotransferase
MQRVHLVVITGPAATGKSTLARALQADLARRGELWLLTELDAFGRGLPREWIAWEGRRGRFADLGFSYDRNSEGAVSLNLGPDGRRVMAAFHRSVAAIAGAGVNVICEAIVQDMEDWADWNAALSGLAPIWVRLHTPVATLEAREQSRGGAVRGLGRGMSARAHIGTYDVEADTSEVTPEDLANRIAEMLMKSR